MRLIHPYVKRHNRQALLTAACDYFACASAKSIFKTSSPHVMGEGPSRAENDQVESILLAEYSALRTEVERRCNIQWSLFALQVTTAGEIASLAISRTSNLALLLLIPLASFLSSGHPALNGPRDGRIPKCPMFAMRIPR